ncbi:MAG: hypothetical protein IPJ38_05550 [Dechloromonas sp.]|uniref:Uncharacterized protein n=1 Tax=Candidatus Dechloromonas phosphorivorans TaxID=2899244 RepID=A0A935MQB4_9RHOO|nr:hypothetical protein [Candidatus Dechloromonas phosphorivorans]
MALQAEPVALSLLLVACAFYPRARALLAIRLATESLSIGYLLGEAGKTP